MDYKHTPPPPQPPLNEFNEKRIAKQSWAYGELIGQQQEWTPRRAPRTVTASGYINPLDDMVLVDTSAGSVYLILESAFGCGGRQHTVKKITSDSNTMGLFVAGGGTIDGQSLWFSTLGFACFVVKSTGTNWVVIAGGLTVVSGSFFLGAPLLDLDDSVPSVSVGTAFDTSGPFSATPPTLTLDASIPGASVIATSP